MTETSETIDASSPASGTSAVTVTSGHDRVRVPASLAKELDHVMARVQQEGFAQRIWDRDATLWTNVSDVAAAIGNRLGWLDAPTRFQDEIDTLEAFAADVREQGFVRAVVCGMGGSSLAPEVLAHAYPRSKHGLPVLVLDSTDPDAVRAIEALEQEGNSLYLIATKSGTTTETLSFLAYFWDEEREQAPWYRRSAAGDSFVAISDPGKSVEAIPHSDLFRETFLNPEDVGGRYSALTYVGLVPAALLGLDLRALLGDGAQMADRCRSDGVDNPGLFLGAAIGALAVQGRDKLTLVLEPELAPFGGWVEQLIAESTGKQGSGIVPVDGEPLGPPEVYGADRVFVRVARPGAGEWHATTDAKLDALVAAGHPVIEIVLEDGEWLGGEFFRWEFATAVAGAILDVNPFDEPNVTESKENTKAVLADYHAAGHLPSETPLVREGSLSLVGDAQMRLTDAAEASKKTTVAAELRRHLGRIKPNGFLGTHAYIAPTDERTSALRGIQSLLRDRTRHASTLGYGPRFLHSTGQLHKGGPRTGCFLQLVAGHPEDVPIPGKKESFGVLIDAQALGDFQSLQTHELPVLRVHLGDDPDAGLAEFRAALEAALTA
jgi:transaldolase/glucose-6-phosphate isomerase